MTTPLSSYTPVAIYSEIRLCRRRTRGTVESHNCRDTEQEQPLRSCWQSKAFSEMNSIISFFQGPFTTDLRTPLSKKWGLSWSFCLNTGKYWSDKKLNTLCKRITYTCLLYFSILFTNTFIRESPLSFCDFFYEYFEINFKNYFVIWFSSIGSRANTPEE